MPGIKNRYPGISPFTEEQKELFFGRDKDIEALKNLIILREQVLLYSKSGIGKTSLLMAGVIPQIKNDYSILKIRFNTHSEKGNTPIKTILNILKKQNKDNKPVEETILDKLIKNKQYKKTLWYYFKQEKLYRRNKTHLLIFDQFEELFTYPEEQINEFKDQLYELTQVDFPDNIMQFLSERPDIEVSDDIDVLYDPLKVKIVYSIRSDRLNLLNRLSDKISNIQRDFHELKPMTIEQAKKAIVEPALVSGENFRTKPFQFHDDALNKIIRQLTQEQQADIKCHGIETTQLQIVCQQIEEDINTNATNNIIIEEKNIPNFKNIFFDYYDDAINKVKTDSNDKVRKFIEDQMIIDGRRISLDELVCVKHVNKETLKTLVNTRLLRVEQNSVNRYNYELSHDTLISPIHEIAEKRRQKEKLKIAEEEAKTERKKLKIAEEKAKIERKKRKRTRFIAIIISFIFLVLITWSIISMEKAKEKESIALKQKEIADSLKNDAINWKNRNDSLYKVAKSAHYEMYWYAAQGFASNKKYLEAIKMLDSARTYTLDTIPTDSLIEKYKQKYIDLKKYEKLLQKAEELEQVEANWLKAIKKYEEALTLDINNDEVYLFKNELENKILIRLYHYKSKVKALENVDILRTNGMFLRNWVESALKICDSISNKDYHDYFLRKQNDLNN